ncbi:MAG: hypothetical protein ACFE9T_00985 [Promethearchaeota archaeon]
MPSSSNIFSFIQHLLGENKIINISGESGTGKTTLALQLVGNFFKDNLSACCIWVQASELFPRKRLASMFRQSSDFLDYLKRKILVTPPNTTITNYSEQHRILSNFTRLDPTLPPSLRYIVIDNISHHLRYEISKHSDIKVIISIIDKFYDYQLLPLIMFCQREGIYLILIHEVTYDLNSGRNRSFLFKLFDRLNTLKIRLSNQYNSQYKKLEISVSDQQWNFNYILHACGIVPL